MLITTCAKTCAVIPKVPPQSDNEVVAVVCYLCHDGGTDEADQPLRRDCACRGTDAGFVHLSCLAEFASFQSKQATSGMIEFIKPWRVVLVVVINSIKTISQLIL